MKTRSIQAIAICVAALVTASCEREARPFQQPPVAAASAQRPVLSQLYPGGERPPMPDESPFQKNAWGIAEGKRLFDAYNCSGCHAHGGGAIGPPLMDDTWIYGSAPGNIFASIVEGRPNGMPTFRNKIPEMQVWQIVAYVQSMGGQAPIDALPSRSDHMRYSTPENARRATTPVQTGAAQ